MSPNESFVLQAASLGQQGQQQVLQPKTGARRRTRFDPVVRALEAAETETSPPQDGGSGVQGGGPALISSGLNDNNESLNQTRGSFIFDLGQGGTDHAGKKQTHPADLLTVKRIASVQQHPEGRVLLNDMVSQIVAERLDFQEQLAARERANQQQVRDMQRKAQRRALFRCSEVSPANWLWAPPMILTIVMGISWNFCLDYVVLRARTIVLVNRGNRTL